MEHFVRQVERKNGSLILHLSIIFFQVKIHEGLVGLGLVDGDPHEPQSGRSRQQYAVGIIESSHQQKVRFLFLLGHRRRIDRARGRGEHLEHPLVKSIGRELTIVFNGSASSHYDQARDSLHGEFGANLISLSAVDFSNLIVFSSK